MYKKCRDKDPEENKAVSQLETQPVSRNNPLHYKMLRITVRS